ncbi:hypothetical protein KY348_02330 [Candidatus Woesearchaeota archaeon]|nr:hypothetical protein [Candidatus Woesearchaeota archaeon]
MNNFYKTNLGWVIRCGRHPDSNDRPERGLPWNVCLSIEEIVDTIKAFYKDIPAEHYVFIHPQREMIKSGNLLVNGDKCIIEAVTGWPEGLSHGKESPQAVYLFETPSLFVEPRKTEGNENLLTPEEWLRIGKNIERKLNYSKLSLINPVVVEFSINNYGSVSAHDVQV